jgi:hypothetical protein
VRFLADGELSPLRGIFFGASVLVLWVCGAASVGVSYGLPLSRKLRTEDGDPVAARSDAFRYDFGWAVAGYDAVSRTQHVANQADEGHGSTLC